MLKQRIITASVLFAFLLVALFSWPAWAWQVLVLAVVGQGAVEWAHLSGLKARDAILYWVLTLAFMVGVIVLDMLADAEVGYVVHLAWYLVAVVLWMFVAPTWMISGWRPHQPWLAGVAGWGVLLPTGLAMLDLRAFSPWALLFVMTMVMAADISAYFAGRRFGKNKLAPTISPGKTWEGVLGALAGASLYVLVVVLASGLYPQYWIIPMALLATWVGVGLAVMGDLFESMLKRQAGVKDSGSLLPGHGGLLDRIDALTSTLPFAGLWFILQRME